MFDVRSGTTPATDDFNETAPRHQIAKLYRVRGRAQPPWRRIFGVAHR